MRPILRFTRVDETLKGPGEELLKWRLSLDFIYNEQCLPIRQKNAKRPTHKCIEVFLLKLSGRLIEVNDQGALFAKRSGQEIMSVTKVYDIPSHQ